jgi:hypothetical protein
MPEPLDIEAMDKSASRQSLPRGTGRQPDRRNWLSSHYWLSGLVSMLVIAGIIGAALVLLRPHASPVSATIGSDNHLSPTTGSSNNLSPATSAGIWVGGTPVTREVKAGGLDFVMQVTPGPYFLGELLAANLSLRNDSHITYTLVGPSSFADPAVEGLCGTAVFVTMSGGGGPQYVSPLGDVPTCPWGDFTLAPGQTMTFHEFMPVTNSGEVTLQVGAGLTQAVTGSDGSQTITAGHSPLDGRWPSITIAVAAATPADRQISLQRSGTQVRIAAPAAALAHLYSIYAVSCRASQGGAGGSGSIVWEPIATTIVHEPANCGDDRSQAIQWWYTVSAPGYAIASGHMGG